MAVIDNNMPAETTCTRYRKNMSRQFSCDKVHLMGGSPGDISEEPVM